MLSVILNVVMLNVVVLNVATLLVFLAEESQGIFYNERSLNVKEFLLTYLGYDIIIFN